jgi:hypothetical protein
VGMGMPRSSHGMTPYTKTTNARKNSRHNQRQRKQDEPCACLQRIELEYHGQEPRHDEEVVALNQVLEKEHQAKQPDDGQAEQDQPQGKRDPQPAGAPALGITQPHSPESRRSSRVCLGPSRTALLRALPKRLGIAAVE